MKSVFILTVFVLAIAFVSSAFATNYYVNGTTGNDLWDGRAAVWDGTHGPKKTIQAGSNTSSDTDTVLVADGTYTGTGNKDLSFGGKAITVKSANGAKTCIIDCEGSGRGFFFFSGEGSTSSLYGFTIKNGSATYGCGIRCENNSSPTISDCLITNNIASYNAGGIFCNNNSSPTITDCIISDNYSDRVGGGICILGGSNPVFTRCTVSNNSTGQFAGGFYWFDSSPTLIDCDIIKNGDIGIFSYSSFAEISNCRIIGNSGIGVEFFHDNGTITNCTISENYGWQGGGVQCTESNCTITNCTIIGNKDSRVSVKCGVYCSSTSSLVITICIIWGNEGDEIYVAAGGSATVTYSDVQGGWTGTGNINKYPKLMPLAGGMLRLRHGSPCIDAGTSSSAPATDMEGRARWDDPNTTNTGGGIINYYDMGAHEFRGWYVNGDPAVGNDAYNGAFPTWKGGLNGPERTIQAGINDAGDGDTVTVAPWTYTGTGNIDLNFAKGLPAGQTRFISLTSSDGAKTTIIDCKGSTRGINFLTNEDETAIFHGFTITNGYSTSFGGAIECEEASPTISQCILTGNISQSDGGAIDCWNASPVITDCKIVGNKANSGLGGGGGIDCWADINAICKPTIRNCEISYNTAETTNGGGISCVSSTPIIINCLFISNMAASNGGGIYCSHGEPTITSSTFSLNEASGCGSGIACSSSSPTITDCILWNDTIDEICVLSGSPVVTYSDVEDGTGEPWFGTGCIDKDPDFVSGPMHNYYLSQISAGQGVQSYCVNAGSASAEELRLEYLTTRTIGGKDEDTVDMGYHTAYLHIYNITRNGSNITIFWISTPSKNYTVQYSEDMITWKDVFVGETDNWTDVGGAASSKMYYRVKE